MAAVIEDAEPVFVKTGDKEDKESERNLRVESAANLPALCGSDRAEPLPMAESEAATYSTCTGRSTLPTSPAREAWCVVGRRGGKSRVSAFVAALLAAFRNYTLAPGERAVVLVIAADRRQSRVVFSYVLALLQSVPALAELIVRQTAESIDLSTGISIEIATASFRTPRGYTIVGCVLDEVAFLMADDSANPDAEIVRAIRPSLASVPGSLLVAISSPYAQRG